MAGNRALAIPYLNARAVQDCLDDVLGIDGWEDSYEVLPDGSVVCTLRVRIGERWLSKVDVGGPSEQPDEGDRRKAAFSDALKRAAVKFGIGRYLYGLGKVWADFDPAKKQFVKPPQLPASALPAAKPTPPPPASGFKARLEQFDARLAAAGLARAGECYRRVQQDAAKAGLPADVGSWNESQQAVAMGLAKSFEQEQRRKGGAR